MPSKLCLSNKLSSSLLRGKLHNNWPGYAIKPYRFWECGVPLYCHCFLVSKQSCKRILILFILLLSCLIGWGFIKYQLHLCRVVKPHLNECPVYDIIQSDRKWTISQMSRVFANCVGDRGSIPGRVIPNTQKWYLRPPYLTLSIIRYGSRVKWSNPGNGVAPSPTPQGGGYWKGNLRVTLG